MRPSRPTVLFATLLLAGLTPSGAGCRKESHPGTPAKATPSAKSAPRGLQAASPALAKAAKSAILDCEVTEIGLIRSCRGSDPEAELARQERAIGARAAMHGYCSALSDENHQLRALASGRLARFAFPQTIREQGDERLLSCLLAALPGARPSLLARPIARAAALLAPVLKREAALLSALKAHPAIEVRVAGYEALFANGRLRILPAITRLLAESKDQRLRAALLTGLAAGAKLEGEERDKVCVLLEATLRDPAVATAAVAAGSLAITCEGGGEKVLGAAEALLEAKRIESGYLRAVRAVAGLLIPRASQAQRQRALVLLGRVVEAEELADGVRATALAELALLDRKGALKLARKHGKGAAPELAAAAAAILDKKQKPY